MAGKAVEAMNAARKARGIKITGRSTKYKDTYARQAKKLCEYGATDMEIADFFGVAKSTLYLWKIRHKDFSEALSVGKGLSDQRVERSLYEKAVGYTFESEKIFQFQGEIVRAMTLEHVPPSDKAITYWLGNRAPDRWRDKTEIENSGEITHKFEELDDDALNRAIKAREDRIS